MRWGVKFAANSERVAICSSAKDAPLHFGSRSSSGSYSDTFHDARQHYEIDAICHFRLGTRQTSVTSSEELEAEDEERVEF